MKVILFGATGMVGQGVLRECLLSSDVERVVAVVRSSTGQRHAKLTELVHTDFFNFSDIEKELSGHDACFYCLGVSSAGMTEPDYQRITYDITMAAAERLARLNPAMAFLFISGAGTDSTEKGSSMWARVKGKTENAIQRLPIAAKYMFRPAYIQPLHGIVSKTKLYRFVYAVMGPLFPLLKMLFPKYVTTTELIGRAMIHVAKHGAAKTILENKDINELGALSKIQS